MQLLDLNLIIVIEEHCFVHIVNNVALPLSPSPFGGSGWIIGVS